MRNVPTPKRWDQSRRRILPEGPELQGGRELSSWGSGALFETAGARIQFDTDHEIVALKSNITQADTMPATPSIAGPILGGNIIDLLAMMEQGCYLRVAHGSGFPLVIVRDSSDPDWHGGTLALPGFHPQQLIVDTAGVWCPPCKHPVVIPPTARYIGGFGGLSLYPIGGTYTDDGGQTYTDAGIVWYVYLEASLFPFTSGAHPTVYSGFFSGDLTSTADYTIYLPAMPMKWSNPRNGINDYRGCFAMNASAAMNRVDMQFHSLDHDCTNELQGWQSGLTNVGYLMEDLPQYVISAYWFQLRWLFDWSDGDAATLSGNTHFQVEL